MKLKKDQPSLWAITATITHRINNWESVRQVPTFYLNATVQGILTEDHAKRVAFGIIDPAGRLARKDVAINAVKVTP